MADTRIRVGVVGASGYSGEELLRLLLRHPGVEIAAVTSRRYAGQLVGEVFPRFAGADLRFSEPDPERLAKECEAVFLALPHAVAADFAVPVVRAGRVVLDLSADFRLRSPETYAAFYGREHPAPDLLGKAVYGLAEWYTEAVRSASIVACPGCYPTSVLLPLLPLLRAGLVDTAGIAVASLSGVTGAGRKVDLPYLFPECNESLRAYKPVGHRHVPEMEQELSLAAGKPVRISFVPHLVPVNRGIQTTIFAPASGEADLQAALDAYEEAYGGRPFVRVLPPPALPDTKHVTFTNVIEIGIHADSATGRFVVCSAVDNLTKGAAGQAVQCFNLRFGFEETEGLL